MSEGKPVTPKRLASWGMGGVGWGLVVMLVGALAALMSEELSAVVVTVGQLGVVAGVGLLIAAGLTALIAVGVRAGRE